MKSALILAGNFRTFDNCIKNINKVIEKFNCDVFVCISDIEHNLHPYNKEQLQFYNDKIINETDIKRKLSMLPNIKKAIFLPTDTENEEIKDYLSKFDTKKEWLGIDIFKQYYKIKKCVEFIDSSYDYIIKSRFDVEINNLPSVLQNNTIYTTNTTNNDLVLISNSVKTFEVLCNSIISHFLNNRAAYLHIHDMLNYIFNENNLKVENTIEAYINKNYNVFDTSITLVSCFYNINRHLWKNNSRTVETYFTNCENVLNKLNPIVIFTTSEYSERIKSIREKYDTNLLYTMIIHIPFNQLSYYDLFDKIKDNQTNLSIEPEYEKIQPEFTIPEYVILINNKTKFLSKVAKNNPFNSKIFQWIDFGIHKNMCTQFDKFYFSNIFYKPKKIRILTFQNPDHQLSYNTHQPTTAAPLFGGDRGTSILFDKLCSAEFIKTIENKFVNQEQFIFFNVIANNKKLFDDIHLPHWDYLSQCYFKNTITVSICMSGHMRSYDQCKSNIQEKIIDTLKKNNFDVHLLLSTWDNYGYRSDNFISREIDTSKSINYNEFSKIEIEKSNREHFINNYSTDNWKRHPLTSITTCPDAVSQLYKFKKVIDLAPESDIIIRIRPDFIYNNSLDISLIKNCLNSDCLYMPEFNNKYESVTKGLMDHFFFGNEKIMKKVMNTYNFIDYLLKVADCHSTECILYEEIKEIKIFRFLCSYGLINKNGYLSVFK